MDEVLSTDFHECFLGLEFQVYMERSLANIDILMVVIANGIAAIFLIKLQT